MKKRSFLVRFRGLTDSLLGAALGALVYAAWAWWANHETGHEIALRAAAVHWVLSTLLTYFGTAWMRVFYALGQTPRSGGIFAFSGGLSLTYLILIVTHLLNGTPNIALTLAAGVIPTCLFCSAYALLLSRTQGAAGPSGPSFPLTRSEPERALS